LNFKSCLFLKGQQAQQSTLRKTFRQNALVQLQKFYPEKFMKLVLKQDVGSKAVSVKY
jgi:hypothetical protein